MGNITSYFSTPAPAAVTPAETSKEVITAPVTEAPEVAPVEAPVAPEVTPEVAPIAPIVTPEVAPTTVPEVAPATASVPEKKQETPPMNKNKKKRKH